ncbi:hypothetical protein CAPTEDRAFT_223604 [Capitella teleta]|uniref:Nucleolar protein 6 n=1 Tax=Capitella teleta TaxID=283909 RepID=R7TVQ4_CAPTE|nr:hypothetical protein CAPTEDRAFT_223604 [Capitella teleta]|eukprot:ELT97667.1 hypothetical protein CAPTEDRAFT_223604 [Capitella teleta]
MSPTNHDHDGSNSDEEISDDFDAEDSDVEYEEEEEEAASAEEPPLKKVKGGDGKPRKAPTAEEMAHLKETQNLFQSNLFRMQITELISEVQVKEKKDLAIRSYIEKLSTALKELPSTKPCTISDTEWLTPIRVPFSTCSPSGKFKFLPPKDVHLVGSFPLGTCMRRRLRVDIAVEIPKAVFSSGDVADHRYSLKRALYLAAVAKELQKSDLVTDVKFTHHSDNAFVPILVLKPQDLKGFQVHVHATPEEGALETEKFKVTEDSARYHSSALSDLLMVSNQRLLQRVVAGLSGMREGIMLLKIWLHQRELDIGQGGVSGFLISMYVVSLFVSRKLNAQMSSYQVFRNTLLQLASSKWTDIPPAVAQIDPSFVSDLAAVFPVVFSDSTGLLNFCYLTSPAIYDRMHFEAEMSLGFIDSPGSNNFDKLFLTPLVFQRSFDHCISLMKLQKLKSIVKKLKLESRYADCNENVAQAILPFVVNLLHKALGQRVSLLAIQPIKPVEWEVTEQADVSHWSCVTFGIILNPHHAFTAVERGPSADTPEAQEFKDFWGEKSDLRRFRDGAICEAVVWPCDLISQQRDVVVRICSYVLQKHAHIFSEKFEAVVCKNRCLDALLQLTPDDPNAGDEQHAAISNAFDDLAKQIRLIKDFPLDILSIQGTDAVFRSCDVFPSMHTQFIQTAFRSRKADFMFPADKFAPYFCPAFKVSCLLEGSGKWPEDLEAVRRLKAACYIQLSKSLHGTDGCIAKCTADYVDVFKFGHVFRISLGYIHEISLAKRVTTPDGFTQVRDTEYSQQLQRQFVLLPKHTSTLHGISMQFPHFAECVRLCKRWVASQLLLSEDMLSEEAIELICAHLYLHPAPYSVPRTPLVGFLRFLLLMSSHDWANSPLYINLNDEFSKDDYTDIQNHFTENRAELPVMFLATPTDKSASYWTINGPSPPILSRLALLAHESLDTLERQLSTETDMKKFKVIFRPPVDFYDVTIRLKSGYLSQLPKNVDVTKTPMEKKAVDSAMPVVDYDPALLFLKELRETFSDIALFFFDCYGGGSIYVLWKPETKIAKMFKVANMMYCQPTVIADDASPSLALNVSAIVEDFKIIGQGIVEKVTLKNA